MREDLLHYVWRLLRFDQSSLRTTQGEPVEILRRGQLNPNAGPDFMNARLRIGETTWAGNVEMHLNSSEWLRHGHQHDRAYDNVLLHVVLDEDVPIYRPDGSRIPCLELRRRIPPRIFNTYLRLLHNEHWIPCQYHFYKATELTKNMFLDRVLIERLERKTEDISALLERNRNDWDNAFAQYLARYLAGPKNSEPAEELMRALPVKLFAKHADQPLAAEALVFGQSGLIPENIEEEFPQKLQKEYKFLAAKYELTPLRPERWKFLRMRPAGFPTVRLAQLAAVVRQHARPFHKVLNSKSVEELRALFEVLPHPYWHTHYRFGRESVEREKPLGRTTVDSLLVNVVAPFLWLYADRRGNDTERDRALQLLEALPAERNKIVRGWQALGQTPESAYRTQALLQLKKDYCDRNRCLDCAIGNTILTGRRPDAPVAEEPTPVYVHEQAVQGTNDPDLRNFGSLVKLRTNVAVR